MQELEKDKDVYIFKCPNCSDYIIVAENELNCKIFRHGVYKDTNNFDQMDPHSSKKVCDTVVENDKITVNVIGIRYELNDPYICVISKLVSIDHDKGRKQNKPRLNILDEY